MHDAAVQVLDLGVVLLNAEGKIEIVNRWISSHGRLSPSVMGMSLVEAFGDAIDPRLLQVVDDALNRGRSNRLSHAFHPMPLPLYPLRGAATERIHQSIDVSALSSSAGRQCLLQIRDMSETIRREALLKLQARQLAEELARLKQAQEDLARHSLRFREMARLAPVGLFETDMQGRLTYCNDRGQELLGLNFPADLGSNWTSALAAEEAEAFHRRWKAATESATRLTEEFQISKGRDERWLRLEAGPIRDTNQVPVGFICTLMDVTELQQRAQRHEHRANHDNLTGLPNRGRFEQRLRAALAGAQSLSGELAIVYLDLDGFKAINDEHGHAAGDQVLQQVGSRLRKLLRAEDLVARLGGDEFAILFPEAPPEKDVNHLLSKLSQSISRPMTLALNGTHASVQVGCSMGVARFPRQGEGIEALLAQADRAMYEHKLSRKRTDDDISGLIDQLNGMKGRHA
ncbi:GGDEF domain-containing protein [Paucibacter sp. TC2R-5]|uniref:GGDEF domain-containing protein n=1 Tax=Paucibacter sp. TC2R-5 TaxID=2893555 RepID=UPI0021E39BB3|nr:GGDEF domain-containing protein [Paucibacter sp. TC2R-5]MCV2359169.1 GGDEF domain-containing protein [Paucibacter sp. TC2R-5]